jgi:hypothetical protein
MKKAFVRLLCLLLGLNVFTACYGPYRGPDQMDPEQIEQELKDLQEQEENQGEPEEEPESSEQE